MNRRQLLTLVGTAALGSWLAQAQPAPRPNLFVTASASTPQNRTPYTISVEVTVENRGQADSKDGSLDLVLKPTGFASRPKNNVATMFDPVAQSQPLPALKPGDKKVFTFQTPYASSSSFRSRSGSFKASNIDPTGGDITVNMNTSVR